MLNPQRSIICQYSEKALVEEFSQIKLYWQIDKTCSSSENREYLVHSDGVGDGAGYVVQGEAWWP